MLDYLLQAPTAIKIENVSRVAASTVGTSGNVVTSFMPSGVASSAQNAPVSSAKLGIAAGVAAETKIAGLTPETKVGCVQCFRISINSRIAFKMNWLYQCHWICLPC